jgi:hypothetical protein
LKGTVNKVRGNNKNNMQARKFKEQSLFTKILAFLLCTVLLSFTSTGCGSKTNSDVNSEETEVSDVENTTEVDVETEASEVVTTTEIEASTEIESETLTEEETTEVETESTDDGSSTESSEESTETSESESVEVEETYTDSLQPLDGNEPDTTTIDQTAVEPESKSDNQVTSNFPVIIDTDFASDADDLLAVRLGLIYQDLGLIDVKAIMLSTSYSKSPQAVSALCNWDGHSGIPIGMNTKTIVHVGGEYVDKLCELGHGYTDYTDTTKLYRKILAESDTKIDIITLGFMQNISDLINSQPDQYSPLNGVQLMQEKVDKLYVVGSNLANTITFNFYWTGDTVINAAKNVNTNCPVEIVYLVTDGAANVWNGSYHASDYKNKDIVSAAMKANGQGSGIGGCDTMCLFEMIVDLYQLNDTEDIQKTYGSMYISDNGAAVFTPTEGNVNVTNRSRLLPGGTFTGQYYAGKIDQLLYAKHKTFLDK